MAGWKPASQNLLRRDCPANFVDVDLPWEQKNEAVGFPGQDCHDFVVSWIAIISQVTGQINVHNRINIEACILNINRLQVAT